MKACGLQWSQAFYVVANLPCRSRWVLRRAQHKLRSRSERSRNAMAPSTPAPSSKMEPGLGANGSAKPRVAGKLSNGIQGLLRNPGRQARCERGPDQGRVSQARAQVPPGRQQGGRCRGQVQVRQRSLRGAARQGEARGL